MPKSPLELSEQLKHESYDDPFAKTPTQESDYDDAIDVWLNAIDPTMIEDADPIDFGQGFIDDAVNTYANVPTNYRLPAEHEPYIRKKVEELINNKYDYLKPYYKAGGNQ